MAYAYLSLGSNLNDRLANIQQATSMLMLNKNIKIIKTSSFYETEPWKNMDLPWFLNAALSLETDLDPFELLNLTKSVEEKLGRKENTKNQKKYTSRIIDIDILLYDDKIIAQDDLIIPHPYMHQRAFVLVPMLEVDANLKHPVFKKTITQLYDDLKDPEDIFLYGTIIPQN